MRKLYIVRHGQDEDNANGILNGHRNTPLTPLGVQQAKEVAEKLKDKQIEVVWTSPLTRAYQTAQIIRNTLDPMKICRFMACMELMERNFGILTGKPVADICKYCTNTYQGDKILYFLEAQGAESFPRLLNRARIALENILRLHPTENILIVTHGDMAKMLRAVCQDTTWEEALKTPYLDNTGIIELELKTI